MKEPLATLALVTLLLAFPLYIALLDWRGHRRRRRSATEAGWRYERRLAKRQGRRTMLRGGYVLVGSTHEGVTWELQQEGYQRSFQFSIPDLKAPYGAMLIVPRMASREARALLSDAGLRTVQIDHGGWQARYSALATHDQLVRRSITPAVARLLLAWPPRNRAGSLHYVAWRDDGLEIRGRLTGEWQQLERIVALGEAIAAQIVATDLTRLERGATAMGADRPVD